MASVKLDSTTTATLLSLERERWCDLLSWIDTLNHCTQCQMFAIRDCDVYTIFFLCASNCMSFLTLRRFTGGVT